MFGILDYVKMGAAAVAAGTIVFLAMQFIAVPLARHEGRKIGAAEVVTQVTKQNQAAGIEARKVKQSVDSCYDSGGTWNQGLGRCDTP